MCRRLINVDKILFLRYNFAEIKPPLKRLVLFSDNRQSPLKDNDFTLFSKPIHWIAVRVWVLSLLIAVTSNQCTSIWLMCGRLMVSDHFPDVGKMVLFAQLRPRVNHFADADFLALGDFA